MTFLSTLSLRRATRAGSDQRHSPDISIHALLAESDHHRSTYQHQGRHFYPRSPCGERRKPRRLKSRRMVFLSTLSLRRATRCQFNGDNGKIFLSTLSLRRATKSQSSGAGIAKYFYPRSPCGERPRRDSRQHPAGEFLSTLSLRRATESKNGRHYIGCISIHALLAESDPCVRTFRLTKRGFLSTLSLRRATALLPKRPTDSTKFLSTLSLRRATSQPPCARPTRGISIHALLAESDANQ